MLLSKTSGQIALSEIVIQGIGNYFIEFVLMKLKVNETKSLF